MVPMAGRSGLARIESSDSATSTMPSSRSSMPLRCLAETGTIMVSPPHSSGTRPTSDNSFFTSSGLAFGLSILFRATMMGTWAALAWAMASRVCGMTPSSAATTSTATSVTWAPRARMAVKASWPGVSRKVTFLPSMLDLVGADVLGDAAGFAGRHVRLADRVQQRRLAVVDMAHDGDDRRPERRACRPTPWPAGAAAAWSPWPARACRSRRRPPRPLRSADTATATCLALASKPKALTTIAAVSKSSCWLMLAMTPLFINSRMTLIGLTLIIVARSRTVVGSGNSTTLGSGGRRSGCPARRSGWPGRAGPLRRGSCPDPPRLPVELAGFVLSLVTVAITHLAFSHRATTTQADEPALLRRSNVCARRRRAACSCRRGRAGHVLHGTPRQASPNSPRTVSPDALLLNTAIVHRTG